MPNPSIEFRVIAKTESGSTFVSTSKLEVGNAITINGGGGYWIDDIYVDRDHNCLTMTIRYDNSDDADFNCGGKRYPSFSVWFEDGNWQSEGHEPMTIALDKVRE